MTGGLPSLSSLVIEPWFRLKIKVLWNGKQTLNLTMYINTRSVAIVCKVYLVNWGLLPFAKNFVKAELTFRGRKACFSWAMLAFFAHNGPVFANRKIDRVCCNRNILVDIFLHVQKDLKLVEWKIMLCTLTKNGRDKKKAKDKISDQAIEFWAHRVSSFLRFCQGREWQHLKIRCWNDRCYGWRMEMIHQQQLRHSNSYSTQYGLVHIAVPLIVLIFLLDTYTGCVVLWKQ